MNETEAHMEQAFLDQEDYFDQSDQGEDQTDMAEQVEWAEVPARRKQDSLYTLFQKVWKTPDSSKVANLNLKELGTPWISVRDAQYLALLASTFKHHRFASFFKRNAEIILSTSASKKGWFTELFVSQKKFTTRTSSMGGNPYAASSDKKSKWSIFGSNQTPQEY